MKKGKIVIVIENLTNEIFWDLLFTNAAEDLRNRLLFGTTLVSGKRDSFQSSSKFKRRKAVILQYFKLHAVKYMFQLSTQEISMGDLFCLKCAI